LYLRQLEAFRLDVFFELLDRIATDVAERLDDLALLVAVQVALEGLGQGGVHRLDKTSQATSQAASQTGRQPDRARCFGSFEIVNKAQVGWAIAFQVELFEQMFDGRRLAGTGEADDKDIESRAGDLQAHLQGRQRPWLPDHFVLAAQFVRGAEPE